MCNTCVSIQIKLLDPELSPEDREELLSQKEVHLVDAVEQRRAWSTWIREYLKLVDPNLGLPDQVMPDYMDSEDSPEDEEKQEQKSSKVSGVIVHAEDYGGSLAMPHYDIQSPMLTISKAT